MFSGVKSESERVLPQRLQLVPLLQLPQFPADFVEEVGALEAAAVAVEADDDGAEAADQDGGPVHPELLRYHLAARRPVPEESTDINNVQIRPKITLYWTVGEMNSLIHQPLSLLTGVCGVNSSS